LVENKCFVIFEGFYFKQGCSVKEKFEDAKGVIRSVNQRRNKQYNGQKNKDKTILYAGRLNSIIDPREKQCTGAPTYTITHRNENVNGR
jgi:hypothetical protein